MELPKCRKSNTDAEDPEGDSFTYRYDWYQDDTLYASGSSSVMVSGRSMTERKLSSAPGVSAMLISFSSLVLGYVLIAFALAVCGFDRCTPASELQELEQVTKAGRRLWQW